MASFIGFPTQIAAAHRTKTEYLGSVPDQQILALFVAEIRAFSHNAVTFEPGVAGVPRRLGRISMLFQAAKSLEYKPDR
jgi:hypothetical protein